MAKSDNRIVVDHVYKTFNIYGQSKQLKGKIVVLE